MKKTILKVATLAAAAVISTSFARSQDAPAPKSQAAPASGGQTAPAAKPKSTTGTAATTGTHKTGTGTKTAAAPLVLKTDKEKTSYAIGMNVGNRLKKDELDVDPAIVARALRDTLSGAKLAMTEAEAQASLTGLQANLAKKQEEKAHAQGEANKKIGEAFLAQNKTQAGVMTTESGLQYKVITEGTGPKPTPTDSVVCNYKGTFINGTEFDSSYKRGQPVTFPVTGVIKGWTEALQLMPVGSKWQLFIPSDLAYGERGAGGAIEPDSTLIFEVELISIAPKDAKQPQMEQPK